MNSNKKTGRIVGILFLTLILAGIPSTMLRGLSGSLAEPENLLSMVSENAMRMRMSILLDMFNSIISIVIALWLFPLLKQYKKSIALGYFGLWFVYFAVIIGSNITHLSLIGISERLVETPGANQDYLTTLGILRVNEYFLAHFISIMLYSMAAWILYFFLFKTRLVPLFLSIWGLIAISIVFVASWLNFLGFRTDFLFFAQNGIFMIAFIIWLLVKGFRPFQAAQEIVG